MREFKVLLVIISVLLFFSGSVCGQIQITIGSIAAVTPNPNLYWPPTAPLGAVMGGYGSIPFTGGGIGQGLGSFKPDLTSPYLLGVGGGYSPIPTFGGMPSVFQFQQPRIGGIGAIMPFSLLTSPIVSKPKPKPPAEPSPHYNEPESVDPMWDAPMEDIDLTLTPSAVEKPDTAISGTVIIRDLGWLNEIPSLGPFFLILKSETPLIALFPDRKVFLEHIVSSALIQPDGSYSFSFTMTGYKPGDISLKLFWKWRILTEGACSVAIDAAYLGCDFDSSCVCQVLADMPAPGSWACSIHPTVFRHNWASLNCPGVCPY